MNENENEPLVDTFGELTRYASLLGDYYKALLKEGFSEKQAFALVRLQAEAAVMAQ